MKFFSNDAARQGDETTYDDDRARERAQAEGTTVPQQRAGSPWSDAPGDTQPVVDFSHASGRTDDDVRDADRTVVIDSADAGVAGRRGDVADRRADLDEVDGRDDVDRQDDLDRPDGLDRGDLDRPDDVDRRDDDDRIDDTTDRMADATSDNAPTADLRHDSAEPVDLALDDDDQRTTTYGPDGTVTSTEQPRSIRDEGTPDVVEPAAGEKVDDSLVADANAEPVAAATPVADEKKAAGTDRFFPEGDDLADRFRDIQLRFVDNPKDATGEAAALVDEALDKLTAALKSRSGDLASNSDDTEKLRVELRGYRELLNRVLNL
ncbi:hypothetical protein HH310_30700 [Actinoplanes sp. TBRC 11911]|uniref:hypothetical protein n=1 Tax=Actinoplanes sp. TBRC 11911 TaxID=2729386 RepID=UPI00145CF8C3|nr:hypothetical protein [Actinoplanes sp. TBRC 11911]NMO55542.1 hypothetical protein [Actinoplanes sp. TBRC 11911]